jgi:hypothetical protein
VVFGDVSISENRYGNISSAADSRRFVIDDELLAGHFA